MIRVDILLVHIERTLAECDARTLPPLTSGPAAVVLDLVDRVGLEVTPWQREFVMSAYAQDERGRWAFRRDLLSVDPATYRRRSVKPLTLGEPIVDEVAAFVSDRRPPWWRRWWSR